MIDNSTCPEQMRHPAPGPWPPAPDPRPHPRNPVPASPIAQSLPRHATFLEALSDIRSLKPLILAL